MKAPDKICVAPHQIFDYDLDIQEVGHNGAEDYIRKDALLKLLKPEKDLSFCEDYERGCIDGRNGLREELLDKLNQM